MSAHYPLPGISSCKVAIASSGLGHVARGIETWASDMAAALVQRGVNVTLYKGSGSPQLSYERILFCWQRDALSTTRMLKRLPRQVSWRIGLGSGYDIEQTTFACRLIKELLRSQIDILHVQDPHVALLAQRAWQLGLLRTRTILGHGTEESLEFQQKIVFLQHLAPWHLAEAQMAGVSKPTWTAIPNFVDSERFTPGPADAVRDELGIPREALVVLSVAAIKRHHKRIDYLVEEFARFRARQPELPLWLIVAGGREESTDELIQWACDKLGDRVRFLPNYPRERMADLYQAANMFILCSLKEMMPIALLEAAATGLPCLVNRHPVLEWMVGPGGASIDMTLDGALCERMQLLLCDPPKIVQLGLNAREHAVRHFSRDSVVDQILDYYKDVLSASTSRFWQFRPDRCRTAAM